MRMKKKTKRKTVWRWSVKSFKRKCVFDEAWIFRYAFAWGANVSSRSIFQMAQKVLSDRLRHAEREKERERPIQKQRKRLEITTISLNLWVTITFQLLPYAYTLHRQQSHLDRIWMSHRHWRWYCYCHRCQLPGYWIHFLNWNYIENR